MICPVCKEDKPSLSSAVVDGEFKSKRCDNCLGLKLQKPHRGAKEYDRERQRKDFRKDIVQRRINGVANPEFLKAYPDKARESFSPDEIRNIERNIANE